MRGCDVGQADRNITSAPGEMIPLRGLMVLDVGLFDIESLVVASRVVAGGTFFGWLGAFKFISADETLPFDGFVALPDCAFFHLVEVGDEAFVVELLDVGDCEEVVGYFVESFRTGHFGCFAVEFIAFFFFFFCCYLEVGCCVAYYTCIDFGGYFDLSALEVFEVYFGVAQLVGRCLAEAFSDGVVVFLVGLCGVESVS